MSRERERARVTRGDGGYSAASTPMWRESQEGTSVISSSDQEHLIQPGWETPRSEVNVALKRTVRWSATNHRQLKSECDRSVRVQPCSLHVRRHLKQLVRGSIAHSYGVCPGIDTNGPNRPWASPDYTGRRQSPQGTGVRISGIQTCFPSRREDLPSQVWSRGGFRRCLPAGTPHLDSRRDDPS